MNPETYLKEYLRPIMESAPPETVAPGAAPGALPFLPRERYYSDLEPSPHMYNFTIDLLTRDELLRLIGEIGGVEPANLKPGQLLGKLKETERISHDRKDLLIEREQRISEQVSLLDERMREIERLRKVQQEPSYRAYRALLLPLRFARRVLRFAKTRLLL